MNLCMNINDYDENNIFFIEKVNNNILYNAYHHIHYSCEYITLNGIYIIIPFQFEYVQKYFDKYKCVLQNNKKNVQLIHTLQKIEQNILCKIGSNKIPQFLIYENLLGNVIKLLHFISTHHLLVLKISGLWENESHYGLTFKFIQVNHFLHMEH